jgi:uncharacterized protein YecE (DUF72 family)
MILPPDHNNVIELRHKSWFCKKVYDLLSSYNAICCILSAPGLSSDVAVTGKLAYVRLHGVDSWYDYNYSPKELKEWARKIKQLKVDTFAYFNNDWYAYAPHNAVELKEC